MTLNCNLVDEVLSIDECWSHTSNSRGFPMHSHLVRLTATNWLFIYNSQTPNSGPTDFTSVILFEQVGTNLNVHGPHLVGDGTTGMGSDRNLGYYGAAISPTKAIFTVTSDTGFPPAATSHYVFTVDVSGTTLTFSNKIYPHQNPANRKWGGMIGLVMPFSPTTSFFYAGSHDSSNTERRAHVTHGSVGVLSSDVVSSVDSTSVATGYTTGSYLDPNILKYITILSDTYYIHDIVGGFVEPVSNLTSINPAPTNGLDSPTPPQGVSEVKFRRHSNDKVGVLVGKTGSPNNVLHYRQLTLSGSSLTSETADVSTAADFGSSSGLTAFEFLNDEIVVASWAGSAGQQFHKALKFDKFNAVWIEYSAHVDSADTLPGSHIKSGTNGYALSVYSGNPLSARLVQVVPFTEPGQSGSGGSGGWSVGRVI